MTNLVAQIRRDSDYGLWPKPGSENPLMVRRKAIAAVLLDRPIGPVPTTVPATNSLDGTKERSTRMV